MMLFRRALILFRNHQSTPRLRTHIHVDFSLRRLIPERRIDSLIDRRRLLIERSDPFQLVVPDVHRGIVPVVTVVVRACCRSVQRLAQGRVGFSSSRCGWVRVVVRCWVKKLKGLPVILLR